MATTSTSKNIDEEIQKFHGLGLDSWLTDQCKAMGLKKPTEIQQNCIPPILRGNGFSFFFYLSCTFAYLEIVGYISRMYTTWIGNCYRFASNCFPMIAASKYRQIQYFD